MQIETPRYYGHISGHVLVKVFVDDGPVGWGEASDSRAEDLAAIARQYNELLVGRDAGAITEINELLRGHAFHSSVTDLHLASAIDLGALRSQRQGPRGAGLSAFGRQDARAALLLLSDFWLAGQRGL